METLLSAQCLSAFAEGMSTHCASIWMIVLSDGGTEWRSYGTDQTVWLLKYGSEMRAFGEYV